MGFGFLTKRNDEIYVLDVGQGSASVILTASGKTIVIDTGTGKTDISDLIKKYGRIEIDYLVLSHGHSDHIGGFYDLIDNLTIKNIIIPDNIYDTEIQNIVSNYANEVNEIIRIKDTCYLNIDDKRRLYCYFFENENLNNGSLCIKYEKKNFSMLFPADIEEETENKLCSSCFMTDCDIMTAAHHGSKNSSTEIFLSIVRPEVVIISVGENNVYGHPTEEAMERIYNSGAELLRTDLNGAVKITVSSEGEYEICRKIS